MNVRGDEDGPDVFLSGASAEVRRAAARLAGIRGRVGTAERTSREDREAAYRSQTGRRELTPAQARRARKKR